MKGEPLPIWSFTYHKGPQPLTGHVYARDEVEALAVATKWCEVNRRRPPAGVQPFIVAGPSILQVEEPPVKKDKPEPAGVAN